MSPTIIHVKPLRSAWKVCASSDCLKTFFVGPDARSKAIKYAKERVVPSSAEIRIFTASGEIDQTISSAPSALTNR